MTAALPRIQEDMIMKKLAIIMLALMLLSLLVMEADWSGLVRKKQTE